MNEFKDRKHVVVITETVDCCMCMCCQCKTTRLHYSMLIHFAKPQ